MRVFDFDNTIYNGESSVDFFMFLLSKKKYYTRYLPLTIYTLALYKANVLSLDYVQNVANKYAHEIAKNGKYSEKLIQEFWKLNNHKLKRHFLEKINEEDVIITASPNVLINEIKDKLKTKNIICSKLDIKTGKLKFLCMGKNKVKAFKYMYPNTTIDEFYTDSMNDSPLIDISNKTFLVKGNQIIEKNKNSKRK